MKKLQNLMKRIESVMVAATFAEAGEFSTAKQLMNEIRTEKRVRKIGRLEKIMMAITFAEAGEFKTAKDIMCEQSHQQKKFSKRKQSYRAPKIQNQLRT